MHKNTVPRGTSLNANTLHNFICILFDLSLKCSQLFTLKNTSSIYFSPPSIIKDRVFSTEYVIKMRK